MSKPNGKPIADDEIILQPKYDLESGEVVPLPKKRERSYPKFTEENRREILLIRKAGLSIETAAATCRISPTTIEKWLYLGESASDDATGIDAEFRTFYLDYLEAESKGILGMRALLQDWATRDANMAKWLAATVHPREFGKPPGRLEVTGRDGGPIEHIHKPKVDYTKFSDEQIDDLIALEKKGSDVIDAEIVE
jgi:hypothetical protein